MPKLAEDPRIDPRLRAVFGTMSPEMLPEGDVQSRQELLDFEASDNGSSIAAAQKAMFEAVDNETLAPSTGLILRTEKFQSFPDGNWVNVLFIRAETVERQPCVVYLHGGGMQTMSCFDGLYRAWGKVIAAQGVAVAMIDFRNAVRASSAPEVAPYPAGLNDCAAGLKWVIANADALNIDRDRIVVAGESGGGNLTLALGLRLTKDGETALIKGLYALCPYISGEWPLPQYPSSTENEGILLTLHNNRGRMAYGLGAFEAKDPQAWPAFATEDEVVGFPPTVISVNEFDPLRDEGIEFYRLLMKAGVPARCRQMMGTIHGTEVFMCCQDVSADTAVSIADFCKR